MELHEHLMEWFLRRIFHIFFMDTTNWIYGIRIDHLGHEL